MKKLLLASILTLSVNAFDFKPVFEEFFQTGKITECTETYSMNLCKYALAIGNITNEFLRTQINPDIKTQEKKHVLITSIIRICPLYQKLTNGEKEFIKTVSFTNSTDEYTNILNLVNTQTIYQCNY